MFKHIIQDINQLYETINNNLVIDICILKGLLTSFQDMYIIVFVIIYCFIELVNTLKYIFKHKWIHNFYQIVKLMSTLL